jgi:hypothetical protein
MRGLMMAFIGIVVLILAQLCGLLAKSKSRSLRRVSALLKRGIEAILKRGADSQ